MNKEQQVLVVEDEKVFAGMMSEVLTRRGYQTRVCHSGEEALASYEPGGFTLVISDLNMPGVDGIELVRRIRELDADQRIVVITGVPSPQAVEECFNRETLCYLTKPFTVDRFLEVVDRARKRSWQPLAQPTHLTLEDLVHLHALKGNRIVLEVSKGSLKGRIWMRRGEIVHARNESCEGEEAFFEMQGWHAGVFTTHPFAEKVPTTIHTSVDLLLLKGARRLAEQTQD